MSRLNQIRRQQDYKGMCNMDRRIFDFVVDDKDNPKEYIINYNIRTIIGETVEHRPIYQYSTRVKITFPDRYPFDPPRAVVIGGERPYHVNWYPDNTWCYGYWDPTEDLWSYVRRLAKTLQFAPEYTNVNSRANRDEKVLDFWNRGLRNGLFPCDKQELSTGDAKKPRIRFL